MRIDPLQSTQDLPNQNRPVRKLIIGAEIMDDPAATPERVDHWFQVLAEYQMPLARVFIPMDESALSRMDWFFAAAERHHVGISATLGGWPSEDAANWIRSVVERYQNSPALDSWILVNEPGQTPEADPQAWGRFGNWLEQKYKTVDDLNRAWEQHYPDFAAVGYDDALFFGKIFIQPIPFLDWYTFWRGHLTWRLNWIADQIRRVDPLHPTHVNPHALISNLAALSIDLPAWRGFLDTYGASCHPSWHFTLLERDQYALGVAYVCDLIRGAAAGKPFWVTELQGGNNTNSGGRPLYPFPEDIAQWLWTSFGSGAERVIFWLLNNRSFGVESGEWSLLDFQQQPSERLETARKVACTIHENAGFFQGAQPVETPITILLSLETMTLQERFEKTQPINSTERGVPIRLEGRGRNAHLLAALAYYEVFHQMGIPVQIKHMHDFDWASSGPAPRLAILPNLAALTAEQAKDITRFVQNGNTALMTGLTGAWDAENRFWTLAGRFPLEDLLGATLREIRTMEPGTCVQLQNPELDLPVHLWVGEIRNTSAQPIGSQQGWLTAVRKQAGKGEVIWIPSLVDLGAWLGDNQPLAKFISGVAAPFTRDLPFQFVARQPGCVLRVLQNGPDFVTVITNGTLQQKNLNLRFPTGMQPVLLWAEDSTLNAQGELQLAPRGTLVALWTRPQN